MRIVQRVIIFASAAILGLIALSTTAWAFLGRPESGRIAAHVTLAGHPIGGWDAQRLDPFLAQLATEYAGSTLIVGSGEQSFEVSNRAVDLDLNVPATRAAAFREGREHSIAVRVWDWLTSPGGRAAPVSVSFDRPSLDSTIVLLDPGPRTPATEPSIRLSEGKIEAVEGKSGEGIRGDVVAEALPDAASRGLPIRVKAHSEELPPRFKNAEAQRFADWANDSLGPIAIKSGKSSATVEPAMVKTWLRTDSSGDELTLDADSAAITKDIAALLPDAGFPAVESGYTVANDTPVFVAGKPGGICCDQLATAAVKKVATAVGSEASSEPLQLGLRPLYPKTNEQTAPALGIKEKVSTFTTNYPAGQPRVTNIHKISDIVRGTVVMPGEIFSLNGKVGPRTTAKGFVTDHAIQDGKFVDAVGGGISQFSTTLFNAAFFAGLDWTEYQAHTIYISRYPYGREATISFPAPDQKIKNTTPYGILIWTSYTNTSVTVTLYSTHYVDAQQTGQNEQPAGACKRVNTERTRHYVDGRTEVDQVHAIYQPAEGVRC